MCERKTKRASSTGIGALITFLALWLVSGCKHHNAINFVTNTEFGVKAGVNAEKIPEVKIGYSRQEAARVPVYLMEGSVQGQSAADITALLNAASASLEKARDASTTAEQFPNLEIAQRLVNAAAEAGRKSKSDSWILPQIKDAANALTTTGANLETKQEIEFVRGMIAAEGERPFLKSQFKEEGKFVATRNGANYEDAYSVIGTFKGSATGNSSAGSGPKAEANMGIAQYFATGIAAQLLAQSGPAIVSTAKNAQPVDQEQLQAEVKTNLTNLEKVAQWIAGGADNAAKKTRYKQALKGVQADSGEASWGTLPAKDEPALKRYLRNNYGADTRASKAIQENTKSDVTF